MDGSEQGLRKLRRGIHLSGSGSRGMRFMNPRDIGLLVTSRYNMTSRPSTFQTPPIFQLPHSVHRVRISLTRVSAPFLRFQTPDMARICIDLVC